MGMSADNRYKWLLAAPPVGVALILLAIYGRSLAFRPFFDDELISRPDFAVEYGRLLQLKVRALSYYSIVWVDRLAGEYALPIQRAVNVLLHLATCGALFIFFRRFGEALGLRDSAAQDGMTLGGQRVNAFDVRLFVIVAVWAVHPMAVYAVAYLVQRSIVMAALLSLLALNSAISFARDGKGHQLFLAAALYVAALFSKEYAIALPAAMAGVVIILRRPSWGSMLFWGLTAAAAAFVLARWLYGQYGALIGTPFDAISRLYMSQLEAVHPGITSNAWALSILNQSAFFFRYLALWLVPNVAAMSIDLRPAFPVTLVDPLLWLAAVAFITSLLGSIVLIFSRRPRAVLAGWSLLTACSLFSTEFVTVWIQDPFVLYRSYLWAIALPGILLVALHRVPPGTVAAVGAAVFALFAALSVERIHSMREPLTVWQDAVEKLPKELTLGQSRPFHNRGAALREAGRIAEATLDFERSSQLGDGGEGMFNIATILAEAGRPAEAMSALRVALARGMRGPEIYYNAGALLQSLGARDEATDAFTRAIEGASPFIESEARARRALLLFARREVARGFTDSEEALRKWPRSALVQAAAGYAALERRNAAEAVVRFRQSLDLGVTLEATLGLAQALFLSEQASEAFAVLDRAKERFPRDLLDIEELARRFAAKPATPASRRGTSPGDRP